METLDDNEKKYLNGATYEKNQEEISDIDELTVMYFFKCCGCPALLFFLSKFFSYGAHFHQFLYSAVCLIKE